MMMGEFVGFEYEMLTYEFLGVGFFLFVVGLIIYEWIKNDAATLVSTKARVVSKYTQTMQHQTAIAPDGSGTQGYHITVTEENYALFETETGEQLRFMISPGEYRDLEKDTVGTLTTQGTKFIRFEQSTEECS